MNKKSRYSIKRRKKADGRPLKKLLSFDADILKKQDKQSIADHRLQFLEELRKEIPLPSFQTTSWSGTALDLLLTDKITPKMHRTALGYTYFYSKNIYQGPMIGGQQWGEDLITFERPKYRYNIHASTEKIAPAKENIDQKFEERWRILNKELGRVLN